MANAVPGPVDAVRHPNRANLVSVVMIFLNAELYIEEAISSVLAQTYQQWELFLVDDGSTDGSTRIAQGFAARHPDRIRYMEHPDHRNLGMSASRNAGIQQAAGEFLALLDADDRWLPEKLERQVATLRRESDAAMVVGPTLWWFGWTGDPADAARDFITRFPSRPGRVTPGHIVLRRILSQHADGLYTCSILARRDAVVDVGGFEDRFRGLFEDQAFFAKFLLEHDIYVMRECLDMYRQHPDSCCAVASGGAPEPHLSERVGEARIDFLVWLDSHIGDRRGNARVRFTIRREIWLHRHARLAAARGHARWLFSFVGGHLSQWAFSAGRKFLPRPVRERLWHIATGDSAADTR